MKRTLILSISITLVGMGCTEQRTGSISKSNHCADCEELIKLFNNLANEGIKTVVFFAEDINEPIDGATFEEFKDCILFTAGCRICRPHPLSEEWLKCNSLKGAWENLKAEKIQRFVFYSNVEHPEHPAIDEQHIVFEVPKDKIPETMKLLGEALDKAWDPKEGIIVIPDRAQSETIRIVTDKNKYIIPIGWSSSSVYGDNWKSCRLKNKLLEWGFSSLKWQGEGNPPECTE